MKGPSQREYNLTNHRCHHSAQKTERQGKPGVYANMTDSISFAGKRDECIEEAEQSDGNIKYKRMMAILIVAFFSTRKYQLVIFPHNILGTRH